MILKFHQLLEEYGEGRGKMVEGNCHFEYKNDILKFPKSGNSRSFRDMFYHICCWLYENGYDFKKDRELTNRGNFFSSKEIEDILNQGKYHKYYFKDISGNGKYLKIAGNLNQMKESLFGVLKNFGIDEKTIKFNGFEMNKKEPIATKISKWKEEVEKSEQPYEKEWNLKSPWTVEFIKELNEICDNIYYIKYNKYYISLQKEGRNYFSVNQRTNPDVRLSVPVRANGKNIPGVEKILNDNGIVTVPDMHFNWVVVIERINIGELRKKSEVFKKISNIFSDDNFKGWTSSDEDDEYLNRIIPDGVTDKKIDVIKNPFMQSICILGPSGAGKSVTIENLLEKEEHEFIVLTPSNTATNLLTQYKPSDHVYVLSNLGKEIQNAHENPDKLYTIVFDECHKYIDMINDELLQCMSIKRNNGLRFLSLDPATEDLFNFLEIKRGRHVIPDNLGFVFVSSKSEVIRENPDFFNRVDIVTLTKENRDSFTSIDYLKSQVEKEADGKFTGV